LSLFTEKKRLADSPSLASYYGQAKAGSRFDASGERLAMVSIRVFDGSEQA
jgi:hypothetical protein